MPNFFKFTLVMMLSVALLKMPLPSGATEASEDPARKEQHYVELLTMLAGAIVVETMLSSCSNKTVDLIAAGAASSLYLVAEITSISAISSGDTIGAEVKASNDPQFEALRKQKGLYEAAQSAAHRKYLLITAAAVAYDVALGLALTSTIVWLVNENSCLAAGNSCVACSAAVVSSGLLRDKAANSPKASCPVQSQMESSAKSEYAALSACEAASCSDSQAAVLCPPCTGAMAACQFLTSFWASSFGSVCCGPDAQKSTRTIPGLSAAAVASLTALHQTLWSEGDLLLGSPALRAVWWGLLSGVAKSAANAAKKQIEVMAQNLRDIEAILEHAQALGTSFTGTVVSDALQLPAIDDLPFAYQVQSLPSVRQADIANLPPSLKTSLGDLTEIMDGIQGKDTLNVATQKKINDLLARSNSIAALNQRLKDNLQGKLAKNKKAPIDLAAKEKEAQEKITTAALKYLADKKQTAREAYDQIFRAPMADIPDVPVAANTPGAKDEAGTIDSGAGIELAEVKKADKTADQALSGKATEYESDTIVQDPDISLFKIITHRYSQAFKRLELLQQ